jgi:hypothetical protein
MRKFLIAAAAGAMMFAAQAAGAAEVVATITHIDVGARIIVVDGRAFHVPTTIDIAVYKVGERVTVVYAEVNGQLTVESIVVS